MKIVGILVLLGSITLSNLAQAQLWENPLLSMKFNTEAWQECSSVVPCDYVKPQEWTEEEAQHIQNTIEKFKLGGLRPLLKAIHDVGFKTFYRSKYWYLDQTHTAIDRGLYLF